MSLVDWARVGELRSLRMLNGGYVPEGFEDFLRQRADCHGRIGSPLAARARADLDAFRAAAPASAETAPGTP